MKLHLAHLADGEELRRLDQSDRVNDNHRCERGVGQQSQQRREQQHDCRRSARRHQRGLLRAGAGSTHDRRLCGAASRRHRAEQRPPQIGHPCSNQFTVSIDWRLCTESKGARHSNRLGEAHQRNSERARQ